MIRTALALLLAASLTGCASYTVRTFYDPVTKQYVCCEATAWSGKDVGTLNFVAAVKDGVFFVRLAETGVNASAPIAAAAIAASDVSAAVTSAAVTAAKFAPK